MDSLSFKTFSLKKKDINRDWFIIDAKDNFLGRLVSNIIKIIRGKHKVYFSPNLNCGDKVIIINARKIKLSGNKWNNKKYITYSGYPGGQKIIPLLKIYNKNPKILIQKSIKGMLPKNSLGREIFNNLYIYNDEHHKHKSQNPKILKI